MAFQQEDAEEELLAQALYVDENDLGEDDDQNIPPTSGEEYLRKVVKESKKLQFATTGTFSSIINVNLY